MPSFKSKADKKVKMCKKCTNTLDSKHTEFVNEFMTDETSTIPELKKERTLLKQQLMNEDNLDRIMDIKDRLAEISTLIKQLKRKKINYYLANSKYIFQYFENKKNIDSATTTQSNTSNTSGISKSKMLFNLFKVNNDDNKPTDNEQPNTNTNTERIVEKYLANVDDGFIDLNSYVRNTDVCRHCNKGELVPIEDEGVVVCNKCFVHIPCLFEHEKPNYKDPPAEASSYAYRRINHFKEILAQFQGKESTYISDEVLDQIRHQIKKERLTEEHLTFQKTKDILKQLGLNKYYEHIAFIKNKLGIKPPVFSPGLEALLCSLFVETLSPYAKVCPNDRVNYLHYYYTLFKLCELIGETQYLNDIPQLKDREVIIEQDDIWKKMCKELNWSFIPTV